MRKADEMEKSQANKSAIMAFVIYTIALLVYSIYSVSTSRELGIPFIILLVGLIIFFVSNLIYRQKMK